MSYHRLFNFSEALFVKYYKSVVLDVILSLTANTDTDDEMLAQFYRELIYAVKDKFDDKRIFEVKSIRKNMKYL